MCWAPTGNGWFNSVQFYGDIGKSFDCVFEAYFNIDFGTIPTDIEREVLVVMAI